jgi:hypothetical protein
MNPQDTYDRTDAGIFLALMSTPWAEERTMEKGQGLTWAQLRYWSMCAALIVVGGAGTIWGDRLPWLGSVVKELSPAIFIAGVLGSFVEPFFRKEFARDAFLAAFRYVLPPEFKDEITKILRFEFIAEKQLWKVQIEKLNNDVAFVTTSFEKTFRNKTSSKKSAAGLYVVPELKFSNGPTIILECVVEHNGTKKEFDKTEDRGHSIGATTEKVDIPPNETARAYGKATQYRRTSDLIFETFGMPAIDPEIEVVIDAGLDYHVEFGTYGDVEKPRYGNRHRLSGVYFSGQHMFVRWWPKERAHLVEPSPNYLKLPPPIRRGWGWFRRGGKRSVD